MTTVNKIITITPVELQGYIHEIARQMYYWKFRPDYVVGITRGGLIPAVMLSQYFDVPMHTLNVSFRDGDETGPESNLWMATDAFGYVDKEDRANDEDVSDPKRRKNILIIDDINDTGRTLQWIKDDWESGCFPRNEIWNDIWHHNVQFATIVDNEASEFKGVDMAGLTINKHEEPCWIEFPWENWWTK
jgi:hypoxanthine phosphoribosyltransferase